MPDRPEALRQAQAALETAIASGFENPFSAGLDQCRAAATAIRAALAEKPADTPATMTREQAAELAREHWNARYGDTYTHISTDALSFAADAIQAAYAQGIAANSLDARALSAPEAAPRQAPRPGSPEASAMIDSVLAEYGWPANPKNAARAGYEAACRLLAARPAPDAVHSQPQMAGLVWALAVRGEHGREAHLMFDTEDQAHAFVEWCKTQIEPPPEREAQHQETGR